MRSEPSEILTTPKYPHQHILTAYRVLSAPGKGYAEREKRRVGRARLNSLCVCCAKNRRVGIKLTATARPQCCLSVRLYVLCLPQRHIHSHIHTTPPLYLYVCKSAQWPFKNLIPHNTIIL